MSGDNIRSGDRVSYCGSNGVVELVADPDIASPETAWHVEQFGSGCLILTEAFGRVFVPDPEQSPDLELISRGLPLDS
jgi:hypothetical protein